MLEFLLVIIVPAAAVTTPALYALRSKRGLKASASLLNLASFTIEVDSDDRRDAPKELPPASDEDDEGDAP